MRNVISLFIVSALLCACSTNAKYLALQAALTTFVEDKDANIGIAVIIDGKDTIAVNGDKKFPMMSVYKFPIALALAELYRRSDMTLADSIAFLREDLHLGTYSPMTERILASSRLTAGPLKKPAIELLTYMLQQSDNNASDIVLKMVGGVEYVDKYLNVHGITDINVKYTEEEMYNDNSLSYENSATPIALASLTDRFDRELNDSISLAIKRLMETCATGRNRLAKPLTSTNAVIGHKTGTGFTLPDGRIMAVNDAGYVHLRNGHRYAIAVFIENSGYDMARTEAMIAQISQIVFSNIR